MKLLYSTSCLLLLVLASMSAAVHADPLDIIGSGGWEFGTSAQFTGTSGVYFDNDSGDPPGLDVNLAQYLFEAGFLSGSSCFWGEAGGGFDPSMLLDASGSVEVTILTEIASLHDTNVFGWFEIASGTPLLHQLFQGTDSVGATIQFSPASPFGFYLASQGETYYSIASLNTVDTGYQHFASMTQNIGSSTVYFGAEDSPSWESDRDYNDLVVRITVPEPGSMLLLLLSLGTVGIVFRSADHRVAEDTEPLNEKTL